MKSKFLSRAATLLIGLGLAGVALGQVPTFTDETGTRLSAAVGVGSGDTSEKAYGVGDFDQDGDDDVVVARRVGLNGNNGSPLPNTLLMNEDGVLTDLTSSLAPDLLTSQRSRDVVVADFDNDGWLDVMVGDGTSALPLLLMNLGSSGVAWMGFDALPSALPGNFNVDTWSLGVGDLANDDDAFPDVFVGVRNGNDRILINLGSPSGLWLGFADESARLGANANTNAVRSVTIYDLNEDGDEDIIEGVTGSGILRMLPNNGTGQFTGTAQTLNSGATYNHALGDLDDDGLLDVYAVKNAVDQYRLNLGAGAGENVNLGPNLNATTTGGFGAACRVADLDGDGTDDFLVTDLDQEFPQDCTRRLRILYNSGVTPFLSDGYPVAQPWTPSGTSDVAMLDIDGDTDLDMLVGHCSGNSVFTQDGGATPFSRGEVNNDGALGLADAISLLGYLFPSGGSPIVLTCDDAADTNDNGALGLDDAVTLLLNLFGSPSVPLPEPLDCGIDATPDGLGCESFGGCP